ncbi:MAG: dienelactone hydrolase family protein [Planctomycetia bacterium]|nr:dienelactone hydrolase family protein [Planctomycetia bacterium]
MRAVTGLLCVWFAVGTAAAQERVVPKEAKGGSRIGAMWEDVPEGFRNTKFPDWPVPTDLKQWTEQDRAATRAILVRLLGDLPARPDPKRVKVVGREQHDGYTLERFEFHNGVDTVVPGILLIPAGLKGPAPTVIALHGHNSSKETVCTDETKPQFIGPLLARKGYVVAAIDAYFNGDRVGRGPRGERENKLQQESSLFKLNLWLGRTLWGMMLRDEQCLLDYLETRPEVDRKRIAATGMSMGCVRASWLTALDDRIHAHVGVCCFTRYTNLIAHGRLNAHAVYFFVPGMLAHFDTEALYALCAPRPMLMLSGDEDGVAPVSGVEVLEAKQAKLYALYGQPRNFRSVVYQGTGHEYLPEMKAEMIAWFERHLR